MGKKCKDALKEIYSLSKKQRVLAETLPATPIKIGNSFYNDGTDYLLYLIDETARMVKKLRDPKKEQIPITRLQRVEKKEKPPQKKKRKRTMVITSDDGHHAKTPAAEATTGQQDGLLASTNSEHQDKQTPVITEDAKTPAETTTN